MSKLRFLLGKLASQLWVRPAFYSLAALFWVFLGTVAEYFLKGSWGIDISRETLVNLFSILASTMLTVAIFSVSAIAAAYASVSTSATPRATKIVVRDSGTQTILGAFLATFIYAVVSLTALSAIHFKASGRLMLFIGFVFLVAWVLLSFLRWVDRVTKLGRMGDTLERVVAEGRKVFSDPKLSLLGCRTQHGATRPSDGHELTFACYGYVQNIDMPALQAVAVKLEAEIWLDVRPGKMAQRGQIYGVLAGGTAPDEEDQRALAAAVSIGSDRNFTMDPRFVLIILAEIAGKALSPAVNDPGTAIQVMALDLELLHTWVEMDQNSMGAKPKYDRIRVPAIAAQSLIEDAFTPMVRDGAGIVEVGIKLHKTLCSLEQLDHHDLQAAVRECRRLALEHSDHALVSASQRQKLHEVASGD
jgi:uncharacterized membrane protein